MQSSFLNPNASIPLVDYRHTIGQFTCRRTSDRCRFGPHHHRESIVADGDCTPERTWIQRWSIDIELPLLSPGHLTFDRQSMQLEKLFGGVCQIRAVDNQCYRLIGRHHLEIWQTMNDQRLDAEEV